MRKRAHERSERQRNDRWTIVKTSNFASTFQPGHNSQKVTHEEQHTDQGRVKADPQLDLRTGILRETSMFWPVPSPRGMLK